jgi:predicted alpha/beta-fold hydrolase
VALLHGLEGSSEALYIRGLALELAGRGCDVTAINFRSCAHDPAMPGRRIPNLRPRFYHSGETSDLDHVIGILRDRSPKTPLAAAGVSLGGNVLLRWLGEDPARRRLAAAATISVPYDLHAGMLNLSNGIARLYVVEFMRSLRPKVHRMVEDFPEIRDRVDLARASAALTFHDFDDAFTAPVHGFASAEDYYVRSSSISVLGRLTLPVLLINAHDDPFQPSPELERMKATVGPSVRVLDPAHGGHAGFLAGSSPWTLCSWAESTVATFLAAHLRSPGAAKAQELS